jgi:hypothetical protein
MLPRVFVSSTIDDLHHLRDAIRDAIVELSYQPVMSEYGDVGYLPSRSAADSCYQTMQECQIAVLMLGKRYGSIGADGKSVTHNEFLAARLKNVPIFCLVDREVLTYKKIFEANRGSISVPGMENADRTFGLIDEIAQLATNNAISAFSSVQEARMLVKSQIGHMVGDLLRRTQDPVAADIRELMADLKTLRHEFAIGRRAPHFMRAARYLLNEQNIAYREIIESLFETIEIAIPTLLSCALFDEAVAQATGQPTEIVHVRTWTEADQWIGEREAQFEYFVIYPHTDSPDAAMMYAKAENGPAYMNDQMLQQCRAWHRALILFATSDGRQSEQNTDSADGPPSST